MSIGKFKSFKENAAKRSSIFNSANTTSDAIVEIEKDYSYIDELSVSRNGSQILETISTVEPTKLNRPSRFSNLAGQNTVKSRFSAKETLVHSASIE